MARPMKIIVTITMSVAAGGRNPPALAESSRAPNQDHITTGGSSSKGPLAFQPFSTGNRRANRNSHSRYRVSRHRHAPAGRGESSLSLSLSWQSNRNPSASMHCPEFFSSDSLLCVMSLRVRTRGNEARTQWK